MDATDRNHEGVDVTALRQASEDAMGWWDGHSWRPDAVTVARADRTILTTRFPTVAKFCERADPPTVLALLDELVELRAEVERLSSLKGVRNMLALISASIAERDAALAKVARVEALADDWQSRGTTSVYESASELADVINAAIAADSAVTAYREEGR